jgi:uncharacterized protein with PQ loop repeat
MIWYTDLLFGIAEIFLSAWTFAQAIHIYRTQKTDGISITGMSLLWAGTAMLLLCGWLVQSISLVVFNGVCLFIVGYIWYKKYGDIHTANYHLLSEYFKKPVED